MSVCVTIHTYKQQGKSNYMHKNTLEIFIIIWNHYIHVKRTNTEAHRSEMVNLECRSGFHYNIKPRTVPATPTQMRWAYLHIPSALR